MRGIVLALAMTCALSSVALGGTPKHEFTDEFPLEDCWFVSRGGNAFFNLTPGRQLYLSNQQCADCHKPGSNISPERVHWNQVEAHAAKYKMNIESTSYDAATRLVTVKYFLSDPTNGDAAYKLTWDEAERRVRITAPDVQGLYVWPAAGDHSRDGRTELNTILEFIQAGDTLTVSLLRVANTKLAKTIAIQYSITAMAIGMVALVRPNIVKRLHSGPELTLGHAALVGKQGVVVDEVSMQSGQIRVGGELWTARPYDETEVIEPGAPVDIFEIKGATAYVHRIPTLGP